MGVFRSGCRFPFDNEGNVQPTISNGLTFGAYVDGELIGGDVFFASLIQGRVYGHLVCLKPAYRNKNVGTRFILETFDYMKERGVKEVFWTFEPLDAGNSTVYINNLGGKATEYISDYIIIEDVINSGVPLDRMVCEVDFLHHKEDLSEPMDLNEVLNTYPLIGSKNFKEEKRILLEIPDDYKSLKARNLEEATKVRLASRKLFFEF